MACYVPCECGHIDVSMWRKICYWMPSVAYFTMIWIKEIISFQFLAGHVDISVQISVNELFFSNVFVCNAHLLSDVE